MKGDKKNAEKERTQKERRVEEVDLDAKVCRESDEEEWASARDTMTGDRPARQLRLPI